MNAQNVHAVRVTASDRPGMLFALTRVLAEHQANITYVDMHSRGHESDIYFEFTPSEADEGRIAEMLRGVPGVVSLEETPSLNGSTASGSSSWAAVRRSARWLLARSPKPIATTSVGRGSRSTRSRS